MCIDPLNKADSEHVAPLGGPSAHLPPTSVERMVRPAFPQVGTPGPPPGLRNDTKYGSLFCAVNVFQRGVPYTSLRGRENFCRHTVGAEERIRASAKRTPRFPLLILSIVRRSFPPVGPAFFAGWPAAEINTGNAVSIQRAPTEPCSPRTHEALTPQTHPQCAPFNTAGRVVHAQIPSILMGAI